MTALEIGLVYETFETYPRRSDEPADAHAEFEPESTIEALEAAIWSLGHRPRRLGSPRALLDRLSGGGSEGAGGLGVAAAFNLAEGQGTRNREAWAPVLLEMAGVPTIGSDALSLSLTLDKAWANRWVAAAGVPIAPQCVFSSAEQARGAALPADFPLFVKPRWEGTAKGIRASSRVESRAALIAEVERIVRDYDQPALVEAFVSGPEYTVTLLGNDPPRALPALQRALDRQTRIGLHALEATGPTASDAGQTPITEGLLEPALEPITEGLLEPALEARLAGLALRVFEAFGCHDFARVDFRLDAAGEPVFLEINPLPTFATDGTFAILAELEGVPLSEMLGRCVQAGLDRLGLGRESRDAAAPAGRESDE